MGDHCPTVFKYLNVLYDCKTPPPTTEPPYVQNKSTMVLTKPPTPSAPLNQRSTGKTTERVVTSESIGFDDDDDEDYSGHVGYILYGGTCIYKNSGILGVLLILAVLL